MDKDFKYTFEFGDYDCWQDFANSEAFKIQIDEAHALLKEFTLLKQMEKFTSASP